MSQGKYRAADEARRELDPDFVLIARTDARGAVGGSLEEAIRRGKAFREAGADVVFVEGIVTADDIRTVVREIDAPILFNSAGISPRLSIEELQETGVSIVILPGAGMEATMKGVWDFVTAVKEKGD